MKGAARIATTAVMLVTLSLAGCATGGGDGGKTTCATYLGLALDLQEQLDTGEPMSDEQQDIVNKMLNDHGKQSGGMNVLNAGTQLIQFCGADGTGTRPNLDRPIEEGVNLG